MVHKTDSNDAIYHFAGMVLLSAAIIITDDDGASKKDVCRLKL